MAGEGGMIVMLYDTESSGLPKWSEPSESPSQPHVCQFTSVLFDDTTGDELEYVDLIIRQEWPVDPEAFAVHKITPAHSLEVGYPEHNAVQYFEAMADAAERVAGFSLDFDIRIMRIAMLRTGRAKGYCHLIAERLKAKKFDVMRACTALCKIPPTNKMMATGRKTWKQPTLKEAIWALFGETMQDAHDARADVLETKRIYMHLKGLGLT
jgi:DNA polymerase III subunit epsilon